MVSYKEAGVDVAAKEKAIEEIKKSVRETFTSDVLGAATTFKFGGTISLKRLMRYKEPVLVLSTDGVGTKMVIAEMLGKYDTVGADILNHSINDVLTSGAKAMFFLDYVAAAKLDTAIIKEIVGGLAKECRKHGIVLAGGETAEMPGVYRKGRVELTGTIGGIVERDNIIDGSRIRKGNVLLGLASTGLHTNGYSLARKVFFELHNYGVNDSVAGMDGTIGQNLIATHRQYATAVLPLIEKKLINGIVHITGGGFPGNVPRVLPAGLGAKIRPGSWEALPVFKVIQRLGRIKDEEMLRTFNMGIGLVLVVDRENVPAAKKMLNEKVYEIGEVIDEEGVRYEK